MSEQKAPPQPVMELTPMCSECFVKLYIDGLNVVMCPECKAQWAPGPDHGMSADSWLDEHGHPHTWPEDDS